VDNLLRRAYLVAMRRFLLVGLAGLLLSGCGNSPVSQAAAIKSAQASVDELSRQSQPYVPGLAMIGIYQTTSAASVTDTNGDVLTVNPAPASAWVVAFAAPPDGTWRSVTALAEVDMDSGVVTGVGLWKIPAGAPSKP
jgi:hypothetical protein